jgi:hypothetical protein
MSSIQHATIDINKKGHNHIRDDVSDITYRSKSCIRRGCCEEKEKILKKIKKKNDKTASKVRESAVMAGGSGMHGINHASQISGVNRTSQISARYNNSTITYDRKLDRHNPLLQSQMTNISSKSKKPIRNSSHNNL